MSDTFSIHVLHSWDSRSDLPESEIDVEDNLRSSQPSLSPAFSPTCSRTASTVFSEYSLVKICNDLHRIESLLKKMIDEYCTVYYHFDIGSDSVLYDMISVLEHVTKSIELIEKVIG